MDDSSREAFLPLARTREPRSRILSTLQSEFVLSRNHVGRMAFIGNGRVELLPVHYVFANGTIVGRTSFGAKCLSWIDQPSVVFEVDESDGLFDWRSVIVRGTLHTLTAVGTPSDRSDYWRAVSAIRHLVPEALTDHDPTPARRVVFAIEPVELSGREASVSFLSKTHTLLHAAGS